ncbi:hypothetical protein [Streptomyces sp. SLBN-134]|uniref:hypothetical protein n=1 Tax=Streptomyces sp. SLBN-134 TaxID=2768456 RepID=UPI00116A0DE6|nr:hypothetical protein [Streptomyces sp. SLBN-134]TQL21945.1 hypothetical protein FBY37_3962 [Streptomyces sp. SLBN-134]
MRHHHGLRRPLAARTAAWAVTVACCPQCQVTPGTPCHDDGQQCTVHPRRIQEAKETCA